MIQSIEDGVSMGKLIVWIYLYSDGVIIPYYYSLYSIMFYRIPAKSGLPPRETIALTGICSFPLAIIAAATIAAPPPVLAPKNPNPRWLYDW